MMTSVRIQNFKGHVDTTVPLGRFTVLVGPNGSGKTSVLQALRSLCELAHRTPSEVFGGELSYPDLWNRAGRGPISLTANGTFQHIPWEASIKMEVPQWQPELHRRKSTSCVSSNGC